MTTFLTCGIHDAFFFAARTVASLRIDSVILQPTPALISPPTFHDRILLSNSPTRASDLTSAAGSLGCSMIRNHLGCQHFKPVHKPSYTKFHHYSYPFVLANLPSLLVPSCARQLERSCSLNTSSITRAFLRSPKFHRYTNRSFSIFYHAGCRNSSAASKRVSVTRRRPAPLL